MEKLIAACKELGCTSVIRYGSEGQQQNVLIVMKQLDFTTLQQLKPIVQAFAKKTGIVPLFWTEIELKNSTDVFPLELIDIMYPHQVLYGTDALSSLQFSRQEVRRQIEFELRSKLIHLRAEYFWAGTETERKLLLGSAVPALMPLFYGLLFLKKEKVPETLHELYAGVETVYKMDLSIMHRIQKKEIKDTTASIKELLQVLETLIKTIDTLKVR